MGRRRRGLGSSLDLLLDTICNTFGGVVFIAILVVVLLRMTGSAHLEAPPSEPAQDELLALEARRDDADARLRSLREAAAQQQTLLENMANPDDELLATRLSELKSSCERLEAERMKSLGRISQSQIRTNEVASQLASLEQAFQEAPRKVAALESELRSELAKRTQDARLPVQRDTDKREIPFLLRAGRLHSVYLVKPDGSIVFNSGECVLGNSSAVEEVAAKPGTGVALEDSDESRAAAAQRLQGVESDGDYLAVFVWPDSFAQFRLLKELLVGRKFEYRLVPMTADGKVFRGAQSKSRPKVQ